MRDDGGSVFSTYIAREMVSSWWKLIQSNLFSSFSVCLSAQNGSVYTCE